MSHQVWDLRMAGLFKKIKDLYPGVAVELEKAKFRSDDDIRTLTREDLHELLRGPEKLKQRKAVYELIHQQQKPIGELLKELKAFIPAESLEAALTKNGILSGYLLIMKDLTSQVEKVLSFLQAHVNLLEEHSYDYKEAKGTHTGSNAQQVSNLSPTPTGTHTGSNAKQGRDLPPTPTGESPATRSSILSWFVPPSIKVLIDSQGYGQSDVIASPSLPESSQSDGFDGRSDTDPAPHPSNDDPDEPPGAHRAQHVAEVASSVVTKQMRMTEKLPTVNFQSIVSGKTLNCEHTILERLRNQGKVTLMETEDSPQLIIVFCPITSRIESDLESVMNKRPESLVDKPVILVMMYHTHAPTRVQWPGPVLKKWNILLVVNVFYHETMHGLLTCDMNTQAINEMHTALLKHCETSICESANDSDIAMSDTCSHDSSASESLVRAGNDNAGTSSSSRTSSYARYGYGTSGSSNHSYGTHTSGVQGNPAGDVGNVSRSISRDSAKKYTNKF